MTTEEANKELERAFDVLDHLCHIDHRRKEAFSMARIALLAKPQEDCISRKSVIDVLIRNRVHFCDAVKITSELKELPSVAPRQKMGWWIWDDECREHGHCSSCGYGSVDLADGEPHDFCRRCGAKMAGSEDGE